MISLHFNRDSVCAGDDCASHRQTFEIDEKTSINDFINFLESTPDPQHLGIIAKISGGEATWILQIKNENGAHNTAVFAQQWETCKNLVSAATIGEVVETYNSNEFYAKYLAQKSPDEVYEDLIRQG